MYVSNYRLTQWNQTLERSSTKDIRDEQEPQFTKNPLEQPAAPTFRQSIEMLTNALVDVIHPRVPHEMDYNWVTTFTEIVKPVNAKSKDAKIGKVYIPKYGQVNQKNKLFKLLLHDRPHHLVNKFSEYFSSYSII